MRTLRAIIVACLVAGYAASLPSHNADSFEQARGIDSVPDRLYRTRALYPSEKNIDNITRRLWEAKKLHVPVVSSRVRREIEDEENPEPKNNIIKGPKRSTPASRSNLGNKDTVPLDSLEMAYQAALEKTRQGYERDSMIAYIREMLPQLSEQAAKEIVDEAVETIVAEDILNWKDQKESLEQMTYPRQPSIPEHVSLSAESEWSTEMIQRMANIKAADGLDAMSLAKSLQNMFPHVDEPQIEEIVAEATKNIKASPHYDPSAEYPSEEDQPPPRKLKRSTGTDDDFDDLEAFSSELLAMREKIVEYLQPLFSSIDTQIIRRIAHEAVLRVIEETKSAQEAAEQISASDTEETPNNDDGETQALDKRTSGPGYFSTETRRRFGWQVIYTLCQGTLNTATIEEQLNLNFGNFGSSDENRVQIIAEQIKAGVEADIGALNAVAQFVRSDREDWSTTFRDLSLNDQEQTGLLLLQAVTRARSSPVSLPDLIVSLREQSPSVEREIAELAARAALFILQNLDYSQELQTPGQDGPKLLKRNQSNGNTNNNDENENGEEEEQEEEEEDLEHQVIVFLLDSIESQIRERAEAGVQDSESIARGMWLKYPFIDLGYLKVVAKRVVADVQAGASDETNDG